MGLRKTHQLLLWTLLPVSTVSVAVDFTKDDLDLVKSACRAGRSFEFTTEADGSLSVRNLEGKGKLHVSKESVDTVDLPDADKKQEFTEIRGCIKDYLLKDKDQTRIEAPSFDFSLEPLPGWRHNPKLGEEFNNKMGSYLNQTVYLSVTLSQEMTEDVKGKPDEYGRYVFTVRDDTDEPGSGGSEYLIHLSSQDKNPFDFKDNVAVLAGYFKVYDINGPRQGFMSVNLRPVKVD